MRRRLPPEMPLPGPIEPRTRYPDPVAQFITSAEFVGGRAIVVPEASEIDQRLSELPAWTAARKTISLVPGVGRSTFDLAAVADPHTLEDVDFAILSGQFGVAENAAIWIDDAQLKHRVLPFITQHLSLVISRGEIVNTMHEAYDRLRFDAARFGTFISGPSKTADIEQSLVIGAHGPRSLTVFIVG
ncbi:MAG TPA: LUD domain-containing protein [Pirellulales bacterium]|nr:LUD domain-containing protein [Pirellulales bacterium]